MIDKMHDELMTDSRLITNFQNDMHESAYNYLNKFYKDKTSYINEKFNGSYITVIKCLECEYKSITYEPFTTINIQVDKSIVSGISELFTKTEVDKTSPEAWKCHNCKKNVNSAKCTKIWTLPEVLVITLKRYDDSMNKITDAIQINKKIIFNKKNIISDPDLSANYKLHAIGLHHGNYGAGHCTTLKYDDKINKIYHINDEKISTIEEVDQQLLHNKEAYIVVYTL